MYDSKDDQYRKDFENGRKLWYEIDGQFERFYKRDVLGYYVDSSIENQWKGYREARRFMEDKTIRTDYLQNKTEAEDLEKTIYPV